MAADEQKTVTVTDLHGTEMEVPVGLDGVNPVSPNNPPLKAVPEADRDAAIKAREAEVEFAEALAKEAGLDADSASTNKEDNTPEVEDADKSDDDKKAAAKKTAASNKK